MLWRIICFWKGVHASCEHSAQGRRENLRREWNEHFMTKNFLIEEDVDESGLFLYWNTYSFKTFIGVVFLNFTVQTWVTLYEKKSK